MVTEIPTNTPAGIAGLRKNDFILDLDHKPVRSLREFRRVIDHSRPGATIAVKTYRDGQMLNLTIVAGKEIFRTGGSFSITFPTVVHGWDLWLNPGFSCVFAGYEPNAGLRHDLGAAREVYDEDWKAFAAIFEFSSGKRILSQTTGASN